MLKDELSTMSLVDFVYNFTMEKLSRHLRHDGNTKHSYFYSSVNIQSDQNYNPNMNQINLSRNFEPVAITTISSKNFTDFISEPHRVSWILFISTSPNELTDSLYLFNLQTVAVLFTSSQCAFCTIFSSILLTISRIFSDADYLKFARIDSDINDLPWQYTMETVPAFIVFNE